MSSLLRVVVGFLGVLLVSSVERFVVSRGSNPSNEDTYVVGDLPEYEVAVYAVFDGHAGGGASAFARGRFMKTFERFMKTTENVSSSLALALKQLDQEYLAEYPAEAREMGACALVVAVTSSELVVANLGDSHAIMVEKTSTWTPLNRMLNAALKEERDRLNGEGHPNMVIQHSGTNDKSWYIWFTDPMEEEPAWRGLQPTRTIGDKFFHPVITATAEISRFAIPAEGARIVLATDGLWDELPAEEVARLAAEAPSAKAAARKLLGAGQAAAAERNNMDVQALVLQLGHNSRNLIDDTTIIVFDVASPAERSRSSPAGTRKSEF